MPERAAVLERNQLLLESAESRAARSVASAYNSARRELVTSLLERWTGSSLLTPGQQLDLVRRLGLLDSIDRSLLALESEVGLLLRDVVRSSTELALEQIGRELALLPSSLRPDVTNFTMIDRAMIEQFVPLATDEIRAVAQTTMLQLRRELQSGLIQGQGFPDLVRRLIAATPSGEGPAVWRNGQLSAERMVRRTVITANNAAKQSALTKINEGGLTVQKQAVASIGSRTTDTCLRVHGQIRDVDAPFDLTAGSPFARQMMNPAFHWNCRTSVVMYHPLFEQGNMTTPAMKADAAAELQKRDAEAGKVAAKTAAKVKPVAAVVAPKVVAPANPEPIQPVAPRDKVQEIYSGDNYRTFGDSGIGAMPKYYKGWSDSVNPEERAALIRYQEVSFGDINLHLRDGTPVSLANTPNDIKLLDAMIDRSAVPYNMHSYRGLKIDRTLDVGETFGDDGFVSTSLSRNAAANYGKTRDGDAIFEVKLKAGQKGAFVDSVTSKDEYEMLLPRGTGFKVVSVREETWQGKTFQVYTAEIQDAPK